MALTAQIALGCHLPSRERIYSNCRVNKERIRLKTSMSVTHFKAHVNSCRTWFDPRQILSVDLNVDMRTDL